MSSLIPEPIRRLLVPPSHRPLEFQRASIAYIDRALAQYPINCQALSRPAIATIILLDEEIAMLIFARCQSWDIMPSWADFEAATALGIWAGPASKIDKKMQAIASIITTSFGHIHHDYRGGIIDNELAATLYGSDGKQLLSLELMVMLAMMNPRPNDLLRSVHFANHAASYRAAVNDYWVGRYLLWRGRDFFDWASEIVKYGSNDANYAVWIGMFPGDWLSDISIDNVAKNGIKHDNNNTAWDQLVEQAIIDRSAAIIIGRYDLLQFIDMRLRIYRAAAK